MHSIHHSLAHRAPPATRSRVRWQPYSALASAAAASSSSTSSRSPALSSISTPATSVSPPPPKQTPLCDSERLRAQPSMPQTPRDLTNPSRDPTKTKYITGLVDQAVKSLCEIWCPQDIPIVFLTLSKATVGGEPPLDLACLQRTPSFPSPLIQLASSSSFSASQFDRTNLVPIKGFVHEVLRRSRTSGSVLQTALCYLEAVRPKVPDLIRKQQAGEATPSHSDSESRITLATPAELAMEAQLAALEAEFGSEYTTIDVDEQELVPTIRVSDQDDILASTATPSSPENEQQNLLSPSTLSSDADADSDGPLPSPLLCPRRAFLASLILASKFTQDKCYSNRAWAKLSGLPAREIGRCERALGDALEWRLWVGKTPVAGSPSTPTCASAGRPLVRCQSETSLVPKPEAVSSSPHMSRPAVRALRRTSTLPADAFASKPCETPSVSIQPGDPEVDWVGGHQLTFSNIAQQDQLMASPELGQMSPTSTNTSSSPSSTPLLSNSPSSTESSSSYGGDRTIQMSVFPDDHMVTSGPIDNVIIVNDSTPWGVSPMLSGLAFEAAVGPLQSAYAKRSAFESGKGAWDLPEYVYAYGLGDYAGKPGVLGVPMFALPEQELGTPAHLH